VTRNRLFTMQYLSIISFFLSMCLYGQALFSALPLYLTGVKGFSESMAGFVVSIFPYTAMLYRPLSVRTTTVVSYKKTILICLLLMAVSLYIVPFSNSILPLIIVRLITGVAICLGGVVSGIVLIKILPNDRFIEGIGYYSISTITMSFWGPAFARFFISIGGYSSFFNILSIILILNFFWCLFVKFPDNGRKERTSIPSNTKPWYESTVFPIVLVLGLIILAHSSISSFLPLYAQTNGIQSIPLFYILAGISMVSIRIKYSLTKKKGIDQSYLLLSTGLMAICLFLVLTFRSTYILIVTALVYGASLGYAQPVLISTALNISPPDRVNSATVTYYIAIDAGLAVGSMLWGFIGQYLEYYYVFLVSGSINVLALFLILHYRRTKVIVNYS